MPLDPRTPVIVGVGQVSQPDLPAPEPVELIAQAARRAADDAGAPGLLSRLDSVRVVGLLSQRYADPAALVAGIVGAAPRQTVRTTMGGNTPQALLNRTCAQIAAGELDVALLGGAESWRTRSWYRKRGEKPPWRTQPEGTEPSEVFGAELAMASPEEEGVGLRMPVQFYPMFETALAIDAGRTGPDQQAVAAALWARFAAVAAANPYAAIRTAPDAATIATPGLDNRVIGYPYTKLMCSNNAVDQAAALLVCSVEAAEAAGVARDRWVFLHSGAGASDEVDVIRRDRLAASPAIRAVGRATLGLAGAGVDDLVLVDLYSCFASAVQVAAAELGLGARDQLTVTGGLTFAGGPWNDYVTHSIATMVAALRERPGELGLVTANGGHLTKHAAGVYGTEPPAGGVRIADGADVQAEVDRTPPRAVDPAHRGPAALEAFTVVHDRAGEPEVAFAYGRTPAGARTVAACHDRAVCDALEGDGGATATPVFDGAGAFTLAG
ncbi:MAG TPA: hypothetical protein VFP61_11345 [Acidimicrobiales bacterium]|nr:hypothetical protein [Acidimicrobiales bacterium]